jgi:hypothetical protein
VSHTDPIKASTTSGGHLADLIAALPDAINHALQTTFPDRHTPALAAEITTTAIRILTGSICPAFPGLCTETGDHYGHSNHEHKVCDKAGHPFLDTGFVHCSDGGPAVVYIAGQGHEDYAPEEVRAATSKIRALLDVADRMADQLLAHHTHAAPVAELHRQCRADYTGNADRRAQDHRDDVHLIETAAEAARASVDRAFPHVARFLADEHAEAGEPR